MNFIHINKFTPFAINTNGTGLLNVAWVHNVPAPSRLTQNTVKNIFFLKVYNELGKVKKFWTSKPLFFMEKVRTIVPPRTIRVIEISDKSSNNLKTFLQAKVIKIGNTIMIPRQFDTQTLTNVWLWQKIKKSCLWKNVIAMKKDKDGDLEVIIQLWQNNSTYYNRELNFGILRCL